LDEQKHPTVLTVFTNDFTYPPAAKDVIFGNADAVTAPARFSITWAGGIVTKVEGADGSEIPTGVALEPTLVAQLNEGGKDARKTVPIGQIPHTLIEGIVLTEDQRFLEHIGLDPRGIARSIWVNLRSGAYVQGASTITQQLARNIYLTRQRSITRKVKEMAMSIFLELRFSKDEILEKYLNEVYFGQSGSIAIHGVSEAAKFYFNKSLDELTVSEQAFLAGIVKGPFYFSPFRHPERAKARQEIVLGKMREAGVITEAQYKSAVADRLRFAKVNTIQNRAPYFTDMVQAQMLKELPEQEAMGGGHAIFSTLDTYYQQLAEASVADGVARVEANIKKYVELEKKKKKKPAKPVAEENLNAVEGPPEDTRLVQGVFVAVDPDTGHILSLVGGRSYEESNYNRALLMKRHIGSLIKPFVYLSALLYGKNPDGTPMNSISKFEDKPFTYEFDKKSWTPKNFEEEFAGTVTMRFALAHSINTVAAQVAIATGLENLVSVLKGVGFEGDLQPLPSLSLGAIDAPPLDVARAYETLANYGIRRELTSALAIVSEDGRTVAKYQKREERVVPPEEAANLVQLMTSVFEIGTGHVARTMGFDWPAAGKTGTTNEFRDAWFAGFTRKVLGISWVGFDRDDEVVRKHRKALKLTGAVAALPVWTRFMNEVHKGQDPLELPYPDGALRRLEVDLISGSKANAGCRGESVVEETFTYRNAPANECN
jgi:penicillin-binding protein 1B